MVDFLDQTVDLSCSNLVTIVYNTAQVPVLSMQICAGLFHLCQIISCRTLLLVPLIALLCSWCLLSLSCLPGCSSSSRCDVFISRYCFESRSLLGLCASPPVLSFDLSSPGSSVCPWIGDTLCFSWDFPHGTVCLFSEKMICVSSVSTLC